MTIVRARGARWPPRKKCCLPRAGLRAARCAFCLAGAGQCGAISLEMGCQSARWRMCDLKGGKKAPQGRGQWLVAGRRRVGELGWKEARWGNGIPFSHALTTSGPRRALLFGHCSSTTPSCPFCPRPSPPLRPACGQRMRPESYKRPRLAQFQTPGQHVSSEREWRKHCRQQLILWTYGFLTVVFFFTRHMHCHAGMLCAGIPASS